MEVRSFLNGDEDFFFPGEVDCFLEGDPALVAVPTTVARRVAREKKGMMMTFLLHSLKIMSGPGTTLADNPYECSSVFRASSSQFT